MKHNFFLLIFITIIFFIGCLNEEEPSSEIKCTYDIGIQQLTELSKSAFPYKGIKNVTFVDSFGIKKVFDVTFREVSSILSNAKFIKDTTINNVFYPSSTIINCMKSQYWSYVFTEIGGSLILEARIFTDFDLELPKRNVIDEVEISITDNGKRDELFPYFNIIVDKRASNNVLVDKIVTYNELSLFGKSFQNVIKNVFKDPQQHLVYYNKSEGIVAFTEVNSRKWRFDSMQ